MSQSQISTPAPEIANQFDAYLRAEGLIGEAPGNPVPLEEDSEEEQIPLAAEAESAEESSEGEAAEVAQDSESEDADAIETLSDLASAFEVDETEFLDHVQVPNREGNGTVSLSEVINAYMAQPEQDNQAREKYNTLSRDLQADYDARIAEQQKLTASLIAQVQAEPNIDWDMLRETDPGRYLKERETRDARRADIQRSLDMMDAEMKRRDEEAAAQHVEWQKEQVETLYTLRPDWKEPETGRAAMTEVTEYLQKNGFSDEQINALEDARSILTVWRAAQWERLQAQKPEVKKRLRLLPRTLRPGARDDAATLSAQQQEAERQQALRGRLNETGSVDDAAALIRGLL